jgi:hypothetical protein
MPDVREVYEMVTKQKPPEPGALERQQKRQIRTARNRKFGAFAIAAAIGAAAIALILVMAPGQDSTTPADEPSAANPADADATAVSVASGFLKAYGAFDAEAAMTYVADDADLTGLIETSPGGVEGLSMLLSWLEASGYEQTITSCEATTLDSGEVSSVTCAFDFHAIRSDEIGRGPFSGSDFGFTVRGGEIVTASMTWDIEKFSPQMWEPFADWVSTTYPKDAAVMYTDGTLSSFRPTERSVQLWEEHTKEYVKEVNRGTVGQ